MIDDGVKVSDYVAALAHEHNVKYTRTKIDEFAETITRLSDDDVTTDDTLDLLVALKRADKITAREMASLCTKHMRQIKGEVS